MKTKKEVTKFCPDCPIEQFSGKRIYCTKCGEAFGLRLCKAIQKAFGYIVDEPKMPKKKKAKKKTKVTLVKKINKGEN